ncbi:PREDICTED: F-box/LRR-repeat protein 6, partial [Condylura cristata]|uniref:F-box/LRR-repeat protein 6 n=1 Tax=Condylura cristata TaxID=143302 RepID=UPI000642C582
AAQESPRGPQPPARAAQVCPCCPPRFSQLQRLTLIHWKSQVHPVLKLISEFCPRLSFLKLSDCHGVGPDALASLARACPQLHSLDIQHSSVESAGVVRFLEEVGPRMRRLWLTYSPQTTAILGALLGSCCPQLQLLEVSASISGHSTPLQLPLEALQKGCPQLQVLRLLNLPWLPKPPGRGPPGPGFPGLEELCLASPGCHAVSNEVLARLLHGSPRLRLLRAVLLPAGPVRPQAGAAGAGAAVRALRAGGVPGQAHRAEAQHQLLRPPGHVLPPRGAPLAAGGHLQPRHHLESSYGRARSDLGVRLHEKGQGVQPHVVPVDPAMHRPAPTRPLCLGCHREAARAAGESAELQGVGMESSGLPTCQGKGRGPVSPEGWVRDQHYNSPSRVIVILQEFCNQLIEMMNWLCARSRVAEGPRLRLGEPKVKLIRKGRVGVRRLRACV